MNILLSILASILITLGGSVAYIFSSSHLPTNECGLDIIAMDTETKNLHFTACLANSGKELTGFSVTKLGDKLFIDLYGRWFTGYSKFNENFNYKLPDDVNEIYLRGQNQNDLIQIWKRY